MSGFSLEDVWAEHKPFILRIGVGLAVFLIGLSIQGSIQAGAKRRTLLNRRAERNVEALARDLEGREGLAGGVRLALVEDIGPEVRGSVEMRARDAFRLREGETEGIVHFQALKRVKDAHAEAMRRGVRMPSGLGFDEKPAAAQVAEQLALLDVGERLVGLLVELKVPKVVLFRPGAVEYVEIAAPEEEGGPGAAAEPAPAGADLVLRRLPVKLALEAPLDTIHALLASLQRPGAALEVRELALERQKDDTLRVEVEVAALMLVGASDMPEGTQSRGASGSERTGRRTRRLRR